MIEKMAEKVHDVWAHWMEYMFTCCKFDMQGNCFIPLEKVKRWKRQMKTKYKDLSESEKRSDRDIVKKFYEEIL